MSVAGLLLTARHRSGFPWGPPTQDTGRCSLQDVYLEFKAGGIRRADGTNCHDCGSSSSVCGDIWFILGAMIALHHRCAAPPSQSPISLTPAINSTHSTHTLHNV